MSIKSRFEYNLDRILAGPRLDPISLQITRMVYYTYIDVKVRAYGCCSFSLFLTFTFYSDQSKSDVTLHIREV